MQLLLYFMNFCCTIHVENHHFLNFFSSKFHGKKQVFSHLDEILSSDPTYMEPTTSGTQYLFSLTGRISAKELSVDDEDETESSGEDGTSDGETEEQTTTAAAETAADRVNAFPKTIILGTGSSFPGVTKSVTSILVRVKLVLQNACNSVRTILF